MQNWQQDPKIREWFELIGTKQTITNYTREFPKFLEFVQKTTKYKTPSQILEARRKQRKSEDPKEERYFEDVVKLFAHDLNKSAYAYNTKKSYLRTVLSFFGIYHVKLEYSRGELFDILEHTHKDKKQQWIPNNEEVRLVYRMANTSRDRAILLTLYQSGLSEIDVAQLKIEQFSFYDSSGNWLIPLSEDLYFESFREKTDVPLQTCISREALGEIRIYLQQRGFPKSGNIFLSVHGQPLDTRGINDIITEIVKRAFNGKVAEWKTKHLRDSFMNALEKAEVPQEIKDCFVGHTRLGAKKHYRVAQDTIKSLYSEAFKFLTINGFGSTSRKMEELEIKFTEQLRVMTEIMTELKTENKTLKQQLGTIESDTSTMRKAVDSLTMDVDVIQKKLKLKPKPIKEFT